MTDEQKRFKIQKIEHYNEQISQENKETIKNTFSLGLAVAGTVCFFKTIPNVNYNEAFQLICLSLGLANIGYSAYSLKNLMESISRKTNLQSKADDINSELEISEELEMSEGKESRGMR